MRWIDSYHLDRGPSLSIILDALNKDRAPKPGSIPTLATPVAEPAATATAVPASSSFQPLLLTTVVLAIGALAVSLYALWWRPVAPEMITPGSQVSPSRTASAPEVAIEPLTLQPAPAATAKLPRQVETAPAAPVPVLEPSKPLEAKVRPAAKAASANELAKPVMSARSVPSASQSKTLPKRSPPQKKTIPVADPDGPHPSTAALFRDLSLLKEEMESSEAISAHSAVEPRPSEREVKRAQRAGAAALDDEQFAARQRLRSDPLASYKILVHVFADEPEERLVVIDGKRLREGDTLNAQYRISAITQTGVRLSDGQAEVELYVQ